MTPLEQISHPGTSILITVPNCQNCHHTWIPRVLGKFPRRCPNCHTRKWFRVADLVKTTTEQDEEGNPRQVQS